MHIWALGLSCETPVAPPDRAAGASHDNQRTPSTFKRPGASNTTRILRKRLKEREKRMKTVAGEGKKSAKFWAPNPSGPHPSGLHPSGLHPSGLPTLRGPTFSRFGPPPFAAPPFETPHFVVPKFNIQKLAEVEIGRSRSRSSQNGCGVVVVLLYCCCGVVVFFGPLFCCFFDFSFHFCFDLPQVSNCYESDSFICIFCLFVKVCWAPRFFYFFDFGPF